MAEDSGSMDVFLDLEPNQPKNDQTRESFRDFRRRSSGFGSCRRSS